MESDNHGKICRSRKVYGEEGKENYYKNCSFDKLFLTIFHENFILEQ